MAEARVILGDCLAVLPTLPAQSFDLVFTDPPYPCIDRPYGYWTEPQWLALMMKVIPQVRRVLNPTGSAVFVLQPNSEYVGRMRSWLWEFMAWVSKEWNIVQDAYWWNPCGPPVGGAPARGMLRPSVKYLVWCGSATCYRNQDAVLWTESDANKARRHEGRFLGKTIYPSGRDVHDHKCRDSAGKRFGVTPFNLMPFGQAHCANGHSASTPEALCDWWLRYLCPPGGSILDPFGGTSTTGAAALKQGKSYVGIERMPEYVEISRKRLAGVATVTEGAQV
jgi:DNA modification methylase